MKKLLAFLFCLTLAPLLHAANATPVSITTATFAANVLTVNTGAPHGLVVATPSAFCISGSSVAADNVCGVVSTVPSGTSFTFPLVGGAACGATCGTVIPAPRIIILKTQSSFDFLTVNYLFWLASTTPIATATPTSWTIGASSAGATSAEKNAIAAGTLVEVQGSKTFTLGTSQATMIADLQQIWTLSQSNLTANLQPAAFYGQVFDGTGWGQQ